jgi:ABC-type Mn2+/Zn2+ transport system ATPase subunit
MTTSAPGSPLIRLDEVTLGYGNAPVVCDVRWTIGRGDLWAVLGRNGSGKSTLIAALLGRLSPQRGSVHRSAGLSVASVPQHDDLVEELPITVQEFVSLGLLHQTPPVRLGAGAESMQDCQVDHLASRQVRSLSTGERRRAVIARALALTPELLVLDEPAAGLDESAEEALVAVLKRIHGDGVTMVWVTHDPAQAATWATSIARIAEGRLHVLTGTRAPAAAVDAR